MEVYRLALTELENCEAHECGFECSVEGSPCVAGRACSEPWSSLGNRHKACGNTAEDKRSQRLVDEGGCQAVRVFPFRRKPRLQIPEMCPRFAARKKATLG